MPAEITMGYMSKPFSYTGKDTGSRRPVGGTRSIVDCLSENLNDVRTNACVEGIRNTNDGRVIVQFPDGEEVFDYVVVAAPSEKAINLIPKEWEKIISCLKKVKYEHTEMVLHTDNSFMPIKKIRMVSSKF